METSLKGAGACPEKSSALSIAEGVSRRHAFGCVRIHTDDGDDDIWLNGDPGTGYAHAGGSVIGNPYLFTGRRLDGETRDLPAGREGLYYYRARIYNPALGRFLQTDPIGYYDSMNLYQYCGNNPVNWIDPWGLTTGGDPLNAEDSLVQSGSMNADEAAAMRSRSAGARNWEKFKQFFKDAWKKLRGQSSKDCPKKVVNATKKQLQSKFKHAKDFGIEGNYNPANAAKFEQAIQQHINNPAVRQITGTYRGQPVNMYVNPETGLTVIENMQGNFISGWKLGLEQLTNVLTRSAL